jgi:hypothetical protein
MPYCAAWHAGRTLPVSWFTCFLAVGCVLATCVWVVPIVQALLAVELSVVAEINPYM